MKYENKMYIINELLPNKREDLYKFIKEYTRMVATKLCMLHELDPYEDRELIQMEAMLLSSAIQIDLIDYCTSEETLKRLKQ